MYCFRTAFFIHFDNMQERSGTLRKRLSSSYWFSMFRLRAIAHVVSINSQYRLLNSVYLTTVQINQPCQMSNKSWYAVMKVNWDKMKRAAEAKCSALVHLLPNKKPPSRHFPIRIQSSILKGNLQPLFFFFCEIIRCSVQLISFPLDTWRWVFYFLQQKRIQKSIRCLSRYNW